MAIKQDRQGWRCEKCKVGGVVEFPTGADLHSVRNLMHDDHVDRSPECTHGLNFVKVDGVGSNRSPTSVGTGRQKDRAFDDNDRDAGRAERIPQ